MCSGAHYASFFGLMNHLLNHPEELEAPPEAVRFDPKCEYHVPKVGQQAEPARAKVPMATA